MTRPSTWQKSTAVATSSLCFLSFLAVVGCSAKTDEATTQFHRTQTELLLKDGNVLDTSHYWFNGDAKIVDSPFRTLPPIKDEYEWFYIYLDAGCKLTRFLEETRTETKQSPSNDSTSKALTGEVEINLNAKGPKRLASNSSLEFNPTSESIGSFDSVFKCVPSTSRSVVRSFEPKNSELVSQIPHHNRARDYIVDQFGTFQSFVYVSTVSEGPLEDKDQKEFIQSIETISFDRERMTCELKISKHAL